MDQDSDIKRQFLKNNLSNQGYSEEEFIKFMANLKPKGQLIESWTIDELKENVQKFKNQAYPIIFAVENSKEENKLNHLNITEESLIGGELINPTQTRSLDSITSIKSDTKVIISDIIVGKQDKFYFSHMIYLIETHPQEWKVERRNSHFERLRNLLLKMYPAYQIPFLNIKFRKSDNEIHKEKNKIILEEFIRSVVMHPVLRTSEELITFLSIQSDEDFEKKFIELEKSKAPATVAETKNPNGQANLILNNDIEFINKLIDESMNELKLQSSKIKENFQKIKKEYKIISELYNNTASIFKEIGCTFKKLKLKNINGIANSMGILLSNISTNCLKESLLVKKLFSNLRKQFFQEADSMLEVCKLWKMQQKSYMENYSSLKKKKEDFSKTMTLSQLSQLGSIPLSVTDFQKNPKLIFSYILLAETNHLHNLKEMYAYFSLQTQLEAERQWNKASYDMESQIVAFSKQATEYYVEFNMIWNDLYTKFTHFKDNSQYENEIIEKAHQALPANIFG